MNKLLITNSKQSNPSTCCPLNIRKCTDRVTGVIMDLIKIANVFYNSYSVIEKNSMRIYPLKIDANRFNSDVTNMLFN